MFPEQNPPVPPSTALRLVVAEARLYGTTPFTARGGHALPVHQQIQVCVCLHDPWPLAHPDIGARDARTLATSSRSARPGHPRPWSAAPRLLHCPNPRDPRSTRAGSQPGSHTDQLSTPRDNSKQTNKCLPHAQHVHPPVASCQSRHRTRRASRSSSRACERGRQRQLPTALSAHVRRESRSAHHTRGAADADSAETCGRARSRRSRGCCPRPRFRPHAAPGSRPQRVSRRSIPLFRTDIGGFSGFRSIRGSCERSHAYGRCQTHRVRMLVTKYVIHRAHGLPAWLRPQAETTHTPLLPPTPARANAHPTKPSTAPSNKSDHATSGSRPPSRLSAIPTPANADAPSARGSRASGGVQRSTSTATHRPSGSPGRAPRPVSCCQRHTRVSANARAKSVRQLV